MNNQTMIQYFEWYLPSDGKHWDRLRDEASHLAEIGITGVWIPPCTKGTSVFDEGYGIYDWYDLGEFDQKGTIGTKYGTRKALEQAVARLHEHGIKVYADAVLNHKAGADESERFPVVEVHPEDRVQEVSDPFEIEGWTRFTFPGRRGQYSAFQYNFHHFTATDRDRQTASSGIFRIVDDGKNWSKNVDCELGNYDYLMYADVDYHHPDVIDETIRWGKWFVDALQLDGFRLDAVKHINQEFVVQFLKEIRSHITRDFFVIGEYWKPDSRALREFIQETEHAMSLFDIVLHMNLFEASRQGAGYDLSKILSRTLVKSCPQGAVTFVDSHDTQRGQVLDSWIEDWFKPLAYALILLRKGGHPCLFYGDYYGVTGPFAQPGLPDVLDVLLAARRDLAYGRQVDVFDNPNVIAWQRFGDKAHPGSGLAVLLSNDEDGEKELDFGPTWAGTRWSDMLGNRSETIVLDASGKGRFLVSGRSVSVWRKAN